jgi:peptidoglycan/LPS O-acetylase OafA/YrhL
VEEQFYLIFILISFFFKRNIWLTILLLYCVYFIAIIYYYFQKENLPLSSLLNTLPCFATGMVVAKLCFYKKRGIPKFIALFLLMAILLEVAEKKFVFLTDLSNLKYALYCSIPLFLVVNFQKQLLLIIKNTSLKITEWLGKITYGLYVYSGIIITAVKMIIKPESAYTLFALSFIILLPVAWLSYKFFEQPFLKLKDRWRYGSKLSSLS